MTGPEPGSDDEPIAGRRGTVVRWAVGLVVLSALVVFLTLGGNGPADPRLVPLATPPPVTDPGFTEFGEIAYRVAGVGDERCAFLADTPEQHARGLMDRTDLGGHDGMLFRFAGDTSGGFYMKNTQLPLSIAWFDAAGRFVSSTEMEPCLDRVECPTYYATAPYRFALEVEKGGLTDLGIGAGSQLQVGGACG